MMVHVFQWNFLFIIMQTKETPGFFVFENAHVETLAGIILLRLTCTWTLSLLNFHQTAFQSVHSWMWIVAYLEEEWVFYVILWNVFVLTSKCLEFMGVGSWRNSDMGQKLQPGRKQCNDQKHYSSANSAAHKRVLDLLFFVWFGRQFNPLRKSLNLCFEKGVLCAQILNHFEKNSWHLYIANLWGKNSHF